VKKVVTFQDIKVLHCENEDIKNTVKSILDEKSSNFPKSQDSLILVKPNLNNYLPSLLGGTTDIRIIDGVLSYLHTLGYKNVVLADGSNIGIHHNKFNIFNILGLDSLAKSYGYRVVDLNNTDSIEIKLGSRTTKLAKICKESDYFINLPKIKTHTEAGLSICMKNLMGCLVGFNKRQVHLGLFEKRRKMGERLYQLNQILKPDLHIVDGLIAMEGDGPSAGKPRKLDLLIYGEDPLKIDWLCAKLLGFQPEKIPYFPKNYSEKVDNNNIPMFNDFKKPQLNIFGQIFLRNLFAHRLRTIGFLDKIFMSSFVSWVLISLGIRQEDINIISSHPKVKELRLDHSNCDSCSICSVYCPVDIKLEEENFDFKNSKCIKCLNCYYICPNNSISIVGDNVSKLERIRHLVQTSKINW